MKKRSLIIYGASGHGKVAADIAKLNGYTDIIFYDDNPDKKEFGQFEVVHSFDGLEDYDIFIAIGDNKTRKLISEKMHKTLITLIHPSAVIADDVVIGNGVIVMANAVINPGTIVKDGAIINTCASVDHDNIIKEYVHLSVGVHTAGSVKIDSLAFVGAGAIIINNIHITQEVMIGAGAVVINDIEEVGMYCGVPAIRKK